MPSISSDPQTTKVRLMEPIIRRLGGGAETRTAWTMLCSLLPLPLHATPHGKGIIRIG